VNEIVSCRRKTGSFRFRTRTWRSRL